ncbi:MAG: hypothetical protein ACI9MR_000393 [Myxococcota bacterium]|jgi:hypothetical protein
MKPRLHWVAATCVLAACAGEPSSSSPNGIAITVAPLGAALDGITDACYRLTVRDGADNIVWQRADICSSQFGNNQSAITYVGTCDAADGVRFHSVRLELEDLYTEPDTVLDRDTYQNPCGHTENGNVGSPPCELPDIECLANQDVPVKFNITVLRDASQGFFDIAVNFDDVFCSSKLDTCDGDTPIELLFNPEDGERGQTAVLALACTAGPGTDDTILHMNPILVRCEGGVNVTLDPTVPPGNAWKPTNPDPDLTDPIWQYAVYRGKESFSCGTETCQKLYWNVAIGFDPSAPGCSIYATATASSGSLMADGLTPAATTYPIITFGTN